MNSNPAAPGKADFFLGLEISLLPFLQVKIENHGIAKNNLHCLLLVIIDKIGAL